MKYPYQDPKQPIEKRISDLLSRMTLEEKFAQMRMLQLSNEAASAQPFDTTVLEENMHRCGAYYNNGSMPLETINKIQEWYLNNTRLGIPIAIHGEALHGNLHDNATVFPQAIGLGATFNRGLMKRVASQIGKETRANGITLAYAPNIDLSRDPRWGRVEENYGEDPYLTSELGVSYIQSLQQQGVAACPKHYIAHGSPEGGINIAPVHAGEREFRETMMVPFEKAFTVGKAMAVMPAYSEWDGVPVHASRRLVTDLLRGEFGFTGQAISDYGAVHMLTSLHHVAENVLQAGKMALYAGIDMEAPSIYGFGDELIDEVRSGAVPMEWVDTAVSRILRQKFEMGLFENPYADVKAAQQNGNTEALKLARETAGESIVLLKNENSILPLKADIGSVALIGPNADNPQLGDYTSHNAPAKTVTLRKALEERLGKEHVHFAAGCTIAKGTDAQLQEAVDAAAKADVAIVVLGDNSNFYGGVGWGAAEEDGTVCVTCGEGFDVSSLDLPGRQQLLLEAVYAAGKPVILVLESGRPYAVCWAKENIPAIIQAWYPGEQGGYALADILFGDVNPSGRLPISFPRSAGHIPAFYNHKKSSRGYYHKRGTPDRPGRDYVFDTPDALFTFGEGLSYTTFAYSDLKATPDCPCTTDSVQVTVTVENTGNMAGYEVVQLYVQDRFCRITPFVCRLRGFDKVWLEPGQKQQVTFELGFEDFAFVNEEMKLEVEPGEFVITVGGLSKSVIMK